MMFSSPPPTTLKEKKHNTLVCLYWWNSIAIHRNFGARLRNFTVGEPHRQQIETTIPSFIMSVLILWNITDGPIWPTLLHHGDQYAKVSIKMAARIARGNAFLH